MLITSRNAEKSRHVKRDPMNELAPDNRSRKGVEINLSQLIKKHSRTLIKWNEKLSVFHGSGSA